MQHSTLSTRTLGNGASAVGRVLHFITELELQAYLM